MFVGNILTFGSPLPGALWLTPPRVALTLLNELVQLSLLSRRERIELASWSLAIACELDGMIPLTMLWKLIKGFLGEDILKVPKGARKYGSYFSLLIA